MHDLTILPWLMFGSSLLVGCSTSFHLASPLEVNDKVGQASGSVVLQDGSKSQFESMVVRVDSSVYYDADAKATVGLPTRQIHSLVVHNHVEGALNGALLGAAGLAAVVVLDLNVNHHGGGEMGLGGAVAVIESALLGGCEG